MTKRRATHQPISAPSSSIRRTLSAHPRNKRPKFTHHTQTPSHKSSSALSLTPASNSEEPESDENEDLILTPGEKSNPISTAARDASPRKKFKLDSIIPPDDYLTQKTGTALQEDQYPPRREMRTQLPSKVSPKKPKSRLNLTREMSRQLLENVMDHAAETYNLEDFLKQHGIPESDLRDQFQTRVGHPSALIRTNLRHQVLNMFDLDLSLHLPNVDHLDGIDPSKNAGFEGSNSDVQQRKGEAFGHKKPQDQSSRRDVSKEQRTRGSGLSAVDRHELVERLRKQQATEVERGLQDGREGEEAVKSSGDGTASWGEDLGGDVIMGD
ncbi:hypothetical protein I302_103798 [Kwoniella bestiolae CBS 10118]|uniref:Uncharacterized protein n=1 Tax=Kwoniella bestiolae CBS 10118 TaxID=1296100 RepID=A0A1B9G9H1_9TREE|nr:hypothetical protein I302_02501 [Kwoniella bestiolae CBS 10118]OCF27657.1 hypothetical protein I302_02501 [Kwoniella bestiolae CBS 10118]